MDGIFNKNNKGFTLVELIATIALLAVISVISFVSINSILNERKVQECNNLNNTIKMATKEYVSDYRYKPNAKLNQFSGDILVDNGYLKGKLQNPYTNEELNASDININVTLNDDLTVKDVVVLYNGKELESICKIDNSDNNY